MEGKATEDGSGSEILRQCRNFRDLSRYFTKFLQKYNISTDFCFLSIALVEIHAVFRPLRKSKGFLGISLGLVSQ
ncbi:hypothetical protein E2R60_23865 [Paenibacillus dendritiformis]|uniref:hypothetical protein n=1 Tax=Paenibacillus dendritiformis TaxID=130049 RepID=UPI0010594F65|nr:hypothetical protein [Paenibacillus dendritiformis]TDL49760.1 hypothetical protein E2R60_23865 [Paenibacillus dendritiformis]